MGLVRRSSRTQYNAICSQPLMVIDFCPENCPPSEAFWVEQSVGEIDQQADRYDRAEDVIEDHGNGLTVFRRRARRARTPRGRRRRPLGRRCRAWDFSWHLFTAYTAC